MNLRYWTSALAVIVSLSGCGGGGGGGGDSGVIIPTPPVVPPALTLIAGNTGGGSYLLDGTGIQSRFVSINGIASARDGTQYVADQTSIRRISPAGVVSTLAVTDPSGAAAQFVNLSAITLDAQGNLYVLDNTDVRRISPAGVVTTFAASAVNASVTPSGFPQVDMVKSISVDSQGNLYIADGFVPYRSGTSYACTIRRISAQGVASVISGVGGSFVQCGGAVLDGSGNLVVSLLRGVAGVPTTTSTYPQIVKIGPSGTITAVVGNGGLYDATLYPGIAIDATGNLYLPSSAGVRTISPTGSVTTIAGSTATAAAGPISVDGNANVYLNDGLLIRRFNTATGAASDYAGGAFAPRISGSADGQGASAQFNNPQGLAADSAGNIYVADNGNQTIRKISSTGQVTTLAGAAGVSGSADGTGANASFRYPLSVATDASGTVYVADPDSATVRKITPAGVVTTLAGAAGQSVLVDGTGTLARFVGPTAITADAAGNLYVIDRRTTDSTIRKITPGGVVSSYFALGVLSSSSLCNAANGIAVDAATNLYVTGSDGTCKITSGGQISRIATAGASGSGFGGIALDAKGNVYFTSGATIQKVATDGSISVVAGIAGSNGILLGNLPGRLLAPAGLTRIGASSLALTSGNSVIRFDLP